MGGGKGGGGPNKSYEDSGLPEGICRGWSAHDILNSQTEIKH